MLENENGSKYSELFYFKKDFALFYSKKFTQFWFLRLNDYGIAMSCGALQTPSAKNCYMA